MRALGGQSPGLEQLMSAISATGAAPLYSSPWQQIGSAMAGYGAGVAGRPNPVMGQLLARREAELTRLTQMAELRMKMQREEREQEGSILTLYRDLIKGPSPEGRKMGAQGIATVLQGRGQPVGPGFVESFASKEMSADQRKHAYVSILAAGSDPSLTANLDRYLTQELGIATSQLPMLKAEAQSPAVQKLLYGQTPQQEQLALQREERDQKRYDVQLRRQELSEAAEQRRELAGDQRFRQAEERLRLAQWASDRADKRFDWLVATGPEEKRQRGLDQGETFVNQWAAAAEALSTKGYLPPPGASVLSPGYLSARTKRVAFPNDPDWTLFSKHLKADIVGYSRNVQGEIGPRFQQAFSGALGLADNPPDIESLRKVFATMRSVIKQNREGKDTAAFVIIRRSGIGDMRVPWKRGMIYAPGDVVVGVE